MKMLDNSLKGLIPTQKHLFLQNLHSSTALYGFQLWFYNKGSLVYPLKVFKKIQRRATI